MPSELDPQTRQAVVLDIARLARDKYVFPEKGRETADFIESQLAQGRYDDILAPHEFADQLTSDLRQTSGDQHWSVSYDSTLISALYGDEADTSEEELAQLKQYVCRTNLGIEKVEHLPGNVGYVDLHSFAWIGFPGAGESIVALMQLISYCDALIFDMRHNHGGEVETLQLYISYLSEFEPHLYDSFYYRPTGEIQQLWTMPYVPGKRMPDVPLYVLTSGATGSGGEAFAYILQSRGRATVVGETTLGAAHTTDMETVQEHFQVEYPSGRSISPFTQGNWEGVGVIPNIPVPCGQAMQVAHLHALERLLAACPDERCKRELVWDLEVAQAAYTPVTLSEADLARYAGQYGDRTFDMAAGSLTYSRQGNPTLKLSPLSEQRFLYSNEIKLEFSLGDQGTSATVTISYRDGRPAIVLARETP